MSKQSSYHCSNHSFALASLVSLATVCGIQLSLLTGHLNSATANEVNKTDSSKPDVRTFKFPVDHSVGGLDLMEKFAKHVTGKNHVAMCKGNVTVTVPPHYVVLLYTNQYSVLHPEILNEVAPAGIDAIKISFMSMDEKEDGLCDKALHYLPHFSEAFRLDVSESDASDAGIDSIVGMPKLKCLWAYASSIRGTCFRNIERFPLLEEIDLSRCTPLHQAELKNLSKLHYLSILQFDNAGIDKETLKNIAGCKSLEFLDLSRNKKINDECMPLLLPLKNLHSLNLQGTEITAAGLEALAPLKLKALSLSLNRFNKTEVESIAKALPHTALHFAAPREAHNDAKIIFTPILGH